MLLCMTLIDLTVSEWIKIHGFGSVVAPVRALSGVTALSLSYVKGAAAPLRADRGVPAEADVSPPAPPVPAVPSASHSWLLDPRAHVQVLWESVTPL